MLDKLKHVQLAAWIGIAMLMGSILGIIIGPSAQQIQFIGDIWLNLLKMLIIPMVMFLVVRSISTMDSPKTLGRIGGKVAGFYLCTTIFATLVAIIITTVLKPGIGFQFAKATTAFKPPEFLSIKEYIVSLFSSNMFVSFYDGNMIQVLVISIMIGLGVVSLKDNYRIPLKAWFQNMTELFMSLLNLLMKFTPIAVFCLMASTLGVYGLKMFTNMAKMLGTFYLASLVQVLLIYLGLLWLTTKTSPLEFLKKSIPVWVVAISTCSSAAVIPVNLKVAREEFDVSDQISSFSIPFGAQFNQDGGAILSCVVILFSAQALGVNFGIMKLIQMVLIATLVSAGSGAVPGGGIVRLMITSAAFGMPLEIVALVAAFYRLFDMGTTSMSVIGDLSGTVLIDGLEKRRTIKMAQRAEMAEHAAV